MGANRIEKINQEVKRELVDIIRQLKDPRIPVMLSVTSINVTRDLKHAKVFVSILEGGKIDDAMAALKKASGFIRKEIAARLDLRSVPEFSFEYDDSLVHGAYMSKLIDTVVKAPKD